MFRIPKTVIDGLIVFGIGGLGLLVYSQLVNSQPMTDSGQKLTFGEWVGRSPVSFKYLQSIGDGTGMILEDWDGKSYTISWLQKDCRSRLIEGEDITNKQNFFDKNLPVCKKDTIQYLTSEYKKYNPGGPVPNFLNTTSTTIVKTPQVQKNTTVKSQEQTISNNSVNTSTPSTTYRQPQSMREELRQNELINKDRGQIWESIKSGDYDWTGKNKKYTEYGEPMTYVKRRGNKLWILVKMVNISERPPERGPRGLVYGNYIESMGVSYNPSIDGIEGCTFNTYSNDYSKSVTKQEWIIDNDTLYNYTQDVTVSCTDKKVVRKGSIKEYTYKPKKDGVDDSPLFNQDTRRLESGGYNRDLYRNLQNQW